MAAKKVAALAQDLEKLEKYLEFAVSQRELKSTVTIKIVAGDDIVLDSNQLMFFDGLIGTLNASIYQTKNEIQNLMFPKKEDQPAREKE